MKVDFCLLGNNGENRSKTNKWYWADYKTWNKYFDYSLGKELSDEEKRQTPVGKLDDDKCKKNNIICLEKPEEANEDKIDSFTRRIKEDLRIDMLLDQLTGLITKADAKQIICHGAPGTGKTYTIMERLEKELNNENSEIQYIFNNEELPQNFVQFHPSYDYTDFIEGLRPVCLESNKQPTFVRMDGIFKRFCRYVAEQTDKDKQYIFVIDEINRADLSKVFGELMYGLDESNRGKPFSTQYDNLPCYYKTDGNDIKCYKNNADAQSSKGKGEDTGTTSKEDVFKDGFYIPENIIIIGTMNDIDKSVESFDFAMQRRFCWVEVDANVEMQPDVLADMFKKGAERLGNDELKLLAESLYDRAKKLNNGIKAALGMEYMIGHAYYKKFASFYSDSKEQESSSGFDENAFRNALEKVWKYSLLQILTSYFRGKKNRNDLIGDLHDVFISGEDKKQAEDQSSAN